MPQISFGELAAWLDNPTRDPPLLLDAREPEEYAVSHLPDAIRVAPGATADQIRNKIDLARPLVLYCSIGYRSSALAEQLIAAGAAQAINLEGSLFKWANEGRPLRCADEATEKAHPCNTKYGRMLRKPLRAGERKWGHLLHHPRSTRNALVLVLFLRLKPRIPS